MNKRLLGGCTAGALALVLSACVTAPEEDPVQIKLNDLDTRLTRIEKVMTNQSLLDVANELEALRADVRSMHNDVDQLNNSVENGRRQNRDLYTDLDQRIKALETRGGVSAAPTAAAPPADGGTAGASAASGSGEDRLGYQAAFNLLKDGQYDRAIPAFQKFLVTYPDSSLADNAQYWLGEAYYVNRMFPEAQLAFQRVLEKYPMSRKIPDALLKIGYCRYETKQYDTARIALKDVVTHYPDTPASRLAQQRLDKMNAENH